MGLADDYCHAIFDEERHFATWPPDANLQLGTYGTWNGCIFVPAGQLSALGGFPNIVATAPQPVVQTIWQSSAVESFTFDAKATVQWPPGGPSTIVTANPGISLDFSSQNQFFVNLGDADTISIDNLKPVMDELLRRAHLPNSDPAHWDHGKYRVVTRLTRSKRFAIAMSRSDKSAVQIEATGGVGTGGVDWGSGSLVLAWARQRNAIATWDGTVPASDPRVFTPFFNTHHVVLDIFHNGWRSTDDCGG